MAVKEKKYTSRELEEATNTAAMIGGMASAVQQGGNSILPAPTQSDPNVMGGVDAAGATGGDVPAPQSIVDLSSAEQPQPAPTQKIVMPQDKTNEIRGKAWDNAAKNGINMPEPPAPVEGGRSGSERVIGGATGAVGGAAAGAQMGTMIMPGYGTAIGAVAGGVAGAFQGGGKGKKKRSKSQKIYDEYYKTKTEGMKMEQNASMPLTKAGIHDNQQAVLAAMPGGRIASILPAAVLKKFGGHAMTPEQRVMNIVRPPTAEYNIALGNKMMNTGGKMALAKERFKMLATYGSMLNTLGSVNPTHLT